MTVMIGERSMSVTTASIRGVSGLVRDAESGANIVVERHGQAVAAIVSVRRLNELSALEADLRSAALVLARAATDTGQRTDLEDAIVALGFDRAELEGELDAELASNA